MWLRKDSIREMDSYVYKDKEAEFLTFVIGIYVMSLQAHYCFSSNLPNYVEFTLFPQFYREKCRGSER
jgi:hypothetical protein